MDILAVVTLIVVVGLAFSGALWLDRRERRADRWHVTDPIRVETPSAGPHGDGRGLRQSWLSWRSLRRWFRRRWCEARHKGEPWKRMTDGANSSTWYCRKCGRTWTLMRG
jgi:hypothetical protein